MNTDANPNGPTSDEKLMGALAHLFGMLIALFVWATQKDKSRFVRFQAIQAMAFDALVMVTSMFAAFCLVAVAAIGASVSIFTLVNESAGFEGFFTFALIPMLTSLGIYVCIFPLSFAVLAVRMVAAVSVLGGKDFRYPILGKKVEAFLNLP